VKILSIFLVSACLHLSSGCAGGKNEFAGLRVERVSASVDWEINARRRLLPIRTGPPPIYGYVCETRVRGSRSIRHVVSTSRFGESSSRRKAGHRRECVAVFDKEHWQTLQEKGVSGEICVASFGDQQRTVIRRKGRSGQLDSRTTASKGSRWECDEVTLLETK
jgi:hypothetical protein